MLFAAGGVAIEHVLAVRFTWMKPALLTTILLAGALFAPVIVPMLSPDKIVEYMRAIRFEPPRTETSLTAALPQIFADQFGWEEMVGSVARVYHHLPPEEQQRAAIFCQNYGEAGAIDFFGPKLGLPAAISGHQNYFLWGRETGQAKSPWFSTIATKMSASYSVRYKILGKWTAALGRCLTSDGITFTSAAI